MAWWIVIGSLAAFGVSCTLWVLFGWLFTEGGGWIPVCWCESALRRCCWLRDLGLLRGPVLAVRECFSERAQRAFSEKRTEIEFCSLEELPARLETERRCFDRTGIGDSPGRDQRGGISEL